MRNVRNVALLGLVMFAGCALGEQEPATGESAASITGSTVSTDANSYAPNQGITVSWTGLPGNTNDWIALAPAGADNASVNAWVYTAGAVSGSHTFGGLSATGSYVARAFSNDSYDLLSESSGFTVAASTGGNVSTSASSYTTGQTIVANWTGLPGTSTDWIAIAPAGSSAQTITAWSYTGGAASGSHSFTGLSTVGNYVVRIFPQDSYATAGEAPFTVATPAAATVSTDSSAYATGGQVVVSYSGLPGNAHDWVAIAPQGSPSSTVTRWAYTNGSASGTMTFEAPSTGGAFVARAFDNDSYSKLGESATFSVGLDLSTDRSAYGTSDHVVVSWANLPGNQRDWIALAPAGSAASTVTTWFYTNGATSGTHSFAALTAGTYVARAFVDDSYGLISETPSFTVGSSGVTVTTSASSYAVGADITVSWTNLPGNQHDWIAIAPGGSSDTTVTRWVYTGGSTSGSTTFSGGLSSVGAYVARAFEDDTYAKLDESDVFNVQ